jgi:hypothetical protein
MDLSLIILNESALKELMGHYANGRLQEGKALLQTHKAVQCTTCIATNVYVQWMNWLIETNENARRFYQEVFVHVQQTDKIEYRDSQ